MMRLRFLSVLNNVRKMNVAMKSTTTSSPTSTGPLDPMQGLEIPVYDINKPQTLEKRKARLHHQSRKRGMLENDLILSTFAKKYLDSFNEEQTFMYDRLINSPSNDWDIYYWIVEKEETPKEFDNEVMNLLKEHAKNKDRNVLSMPNLY